MFAGKNARYEKRYALIPNNGNDAMLEYPRAAFGQHWFTSMIAGGKQYEGAVGSGLFF